VRHHPVSSKSLLRDLWLVASRDAVGNGEGRAEYERTDNEGHGQGTSFVATISTGAAECDP
jgi:hypothetical protein